MGLKSIKQPSILVVSSNASRTKIISESLGKGGFHVMIATRGKRACEIIHSQRPDLAVVDYRLPDLNSLSLVRSIRADEWAFNLPVIVQGSEIRDEDILLCLEAGADACLREPFLPEFFVARVRALLRRCRTCEPQP